MAEDRATPELLTDKDVERLYQIGRGTQKTLRARGQIPFVRIGGRMVRYEPSALAAWIAAGRR